MRSSSFPTKLLPAILTMAAIAFAATPIFRSVGPGEDSDLIYGMGISVEISGNTATFSSHLPARVGVGDVLQYSAGGAPCVAFIHGRNSAKEYTVQNAAGESPAQAPAGTLVGIFRAYVSLQNAVDGIENTKFNDVVEDFDDIAVLRDLVSRGNQLNIACYNDGVSTQTLAFDSIHDAAPLSSRLWKTDVNHYVRFFTPSKSSEAGKSQRHTGKAGTGFVMKPFEVSSHIAWLGVDYTVFDGFELVGTESNDCHSAEAVRVAGDHCTIRNCIVRGMKNQRGDGILMYDRGFSVTVENCIIYDMQRCGIAVQPYKGSHTQNWVIRNTTIFNCGQMPVGPSNANCTPPNVHPACGWWAAGGIGIYAKGGPHTVNVHIENCIIMETVNFKDITINKSNTTLNLSGNNNITSDGTGAGYGLINVDTSTSAGGGANVVVFKNLDSANVDLHLQNMASSLNKAIAGGADLSGSFADDIDGQTRPANWDIGADQAELGVDVSAPEVTAVPSPGAGVRWYIDTTYSIEWAAMDNVGVDSIKLYYKVGSGDWTEITTLSGEKTSFDWRVLTSGAEGAARIKVEAIDGAEKVGWATSDEFTIEKFEVDSIPPVVMITRPTPSDTFVMHSTDSIRWDITEVVGVDKILIEYQIGNGSWLPVESGVPGDSRSRAWFVSTHTSGQARIKVTAWDHAQNKGHHISDWFTIKAPLPKVGEITEPAKDGKSLPLGGSATIKWGGESFVDTRDVVFSKDQTVWESIVTKHTKSEVEWGPLPTDMGTYFIKVIVRNSDGVPTETPPRRVLIEKKPHFTCDTQWEVMVGEPNAYPVTFEDEGFVGDPGVTLLKQKSGSWVVPVGITELRGTPAVSATFPDTVWLQLKIGPGVDTLVLVIKEKTSALRPTIAAVLPSTFNVRPAQQLGFIEFLVSMDREGRFGISLYNVRGRRIWAHQSGRVSRGIYRVGTSRSAIPSGAYLMLASRQGKRITRKVVVMR